MIEPKVRHVDKSSFSPRQRRRLIKKYRRHATVVAAHANDPDVPLS